ncbi:MAG: signal peptide peptidase SppA [Planctomycetota bacterium]|nr:MAG: signal peptide peptidase SppA [Planctomycetota bacterium]
MRMDNDRHQPPTRVILEQGGLWGRWGTRLAWIVAGLSFLSAVASAGAFSQYFQRDARVLEKYHSLAKLATDKVAIVTVAGAIMGGDGFVRAQLDQIEEDPHVKAVVLRVDSPGGTVSGSDELHHRIGQLARRRELPVVVSMGGIAASGGYYVAMANGGREDVIFAEPATLTGSIGVIIPHFDLSRTLKRFDVADDSIASGPLKEMLSPTKERTPELAERERKLLQGLVDDMFARFKSIVKQGRPKLDDAAVDRVATGQIFTAQQALDAGLVDRIGFLEEAVSRAVELAGLDEHRARVVKYVRPRGLLDEVLGNGATPGGKTSLEMVAELTTPRGWYLCSWWPALVAAGQSQP